MSLNLEPLFEAYNIVDDVISCKAIGQGLINETYLLETDAAVVGRYIVQSINTSIFNDPSSLQNNILRVLKHLESKKASSGETFVKMRLTGQRDSFYVDADSVVWRVFDFVEDSLSLDRLATERQAFEAGRILADFHVSLMDFPNPPLTVTLPGFHDTPTYLTTFFASLEEDRFNRARYIGDEIRFIRQWAECSDILNHGVAQGNLHLCVSHGDTKVSNILFDRTGDKALCLVDFDTVMNGLWLHDFGDLVRSGCNTMLENESNVEKVRFNLSFFDAIREGYLSLADKYLTPMEVELLPLSGQIITFELSIRFLTDYLKGDIYFQTTHPDENLQRFRIQRRLFESMEDSFRGIASRYCT